MDIDDFILGAHVSISGGISNAPIRGVEIGCDAIQIFTKNQVQWKSTPLKNNEISKFRKEYDVSGLRTLIVHCSYLINLASIKPDIFNKSLKSFTDELRRAEQIGALYLVIHPGAHMGEGEQSGLRRVADSVRIALEDSGTEKIKILFETTSGQGTVLGYTFEQLAFLLDEVNVRSRVGICVDTCHVFSAGYDLRTETDCRKTFDLFQSVIGIDRLKLLHFNDSKNEFNSRKDRHENIGKGFIGEKGFRAILSDPRLKGIPAILETPGGPERYREELKLLRSFIE